MNRKFFILVTIITTIIAFFIFITAQNKSEKKRLEQKYERVEQRRARLEQMHRIQEEKRKQEEIERNARFRQERNKRFQSKQNNAIQKINNLENRYNNLLTNYGRANGGYEKIQIRKELERILESINYIAIKEHLSDKKINNIQSKVYNDILRRYGHM